MSASTSHVSLLLVVIAQMVELSYFCGPSTGGSNSNSNSNSNTGQSGAIQQFFGSGVSVSDYDTSGFQNKQGGPVSSGSDLACNFESSCCWKNLSPPDDQLDWQTASGSVDTSKLQQNFGTSTAPSGKFLAVAVTNSHPATDNAQFSSCSIQCSKGPISVTLKSWRTPGTQLQVCLKDAVDSSRPVTGCQTVTGDNPGPTTWQLQSSNFVDIVLMANSFTNGGGGAVAVDDITVQFTPCDNNTSGGGGGFAAACSALQCGFDSNLCQYQDKSQGGGGGSTPQFTQLSKNVGNRDTGVPGPPDGSSGYAGTKVNPGQTAVLASPSFSLNQPAKLQFQYFEATEGLVLRNCVGDLNTCTDVSNPHVSVADRNWQQAQIDIPQGSSQVINLVAVNSGKNLGAVGIDAVTVVDSTGANQCSSSSGSSGASSRRR